MPDHRERKAGRRRRIAESSARLFSGKGFVQTSMKDVADGAGVGVGTVYAHFGSKGGLLAALMGPQLMELLDAGRDMMDRAASLEPQAAVTQLLLAYCDHLLSCNRRLLRATVGVAIAKPASFDRQTPNLRSQLIDQITDLLHRLRKRGGIGTSVPLETAALVLYGLFVSSLMLYLSDDTMSADAFKALVTDGILHVFGPWRPPTNSS